jgi:adenosylhomocysteine nucleosidase
VGGHGKTQLAVHTQHLIEQMPELRAVVCAGAAGALDGQLVLGDVVVGTSTIEHDYKIRFVQRPLPRHEADAQLLREFRVAADQPGREFSVLFGAIASGDEDIIAPARALELREATGALCVAWEGAGAARAASFSGLPFLEVRAITDGADRAAAADFQENLEHSMPNLGHLLLKWFLVRRQGLPHGSRGQSSLPAEP